MENTEKIDNDEFVLTDVVMHGQSLKVYIVLIIFSPENRKTFI